MGSAELEKEGVCCTECLGLNHLPAWCRVLVLELASMADVRRKNIQGA